MQQKKKQKRFSKIKKKKTAGGELDETLARGTHLLVCRPPSGVSVPNVRQTRREPQPKM
jgi:hypothetical protein